MTENIKNFELEVTRMIKAGAQSREQAIKWLCQAYGMRSPQRLAWRFQVPREYVTGEARG